MKVLVTGGSGQLGYDVCKELKKRKHIVVGTDRTEMDITDKEAVAVRLSRINPDIVVHCAAWTEVDDAESACRYKIVRSINSEGTRYIAESCRQLDIKMMYISTDYVFDGSGTKPWCPDCREFGPLNVYGQTKLEGETAVSQIVPKYFIVRTAWLFGKNGQNFVRTMLKAGSTYHALSVVNDQIGTPTYTVDLARLLVDMAETEKYGYYHATNEGEYVSRYDFAAEIFRQMAQRGYQEYDSKHLIMKQIASANYMHSKAMRPHNSRMDKSKLDKNGFMKLPEWKDAITRYLGELGL